MLNHHADLVVQMSKLKEYWFSEREKPLDAWDPAPVPQVETGGLDLVEEIVAKFENAKEFHDHWRQEIFLNSSKVK